jgi:hypothetical protein
MSNWEKFRLIAAIVITILFTLAITQITNINWEKQVEIQRLRTIEFQCRWKMDSLEAVEGKGEWKNVGSFVKQ